MLILLIRLEPSDLKSSDMSPKLKGKKQFEFIKQIVNFPKRESILQIINPINIIVLYQKIDKLTSKKALKSRAFNKN